MQEMLCRNLFLMFFFNARKLAFRAFSRKTGGHNIIGHYYSESERIIVINAVLINDVCVATQMYM